MIWNLHRTLLELLCDGVKNNNTARQQIITIYQKVTCPWHAFTLQFQNKDMLERLHQCWGINPSTSPRPQLRTELWRQENQVFIVVSFIFKRSLKINYSRNKISFSLVKFFNENELVENRVHMWWNTWGLQHTILCTINFVCHHFYIQMYCFSNL